MKFNMISRYLFLLLLGLGLTPSGYADSETNKTTVAEINQQTQDLLKSLKSYTAAQRDEAIEKTKLALEILDKRIDELEKAIADNWNKMDKAAREKSHESLMALHQQRIQVAEWYGSLKKSSVGAWGEIKTGLSSAYSELHEAWVKAEKEYNAEKQ